MGIRFYCPNGHKLNVKSFLAGKVGYCPECGTKVKIPYEDTRPSGKEVRRRMVGNEQQSPTEPIEKTTETPSDEDLELIVDEVTTDLAADKIVVVNNEVAESTTKAAIIDEPFIPITNNTADPNLSDPTLIWHVSSPDGHHQYGPITGKDLLVWLSENRIAPNMMLWQQNWKSWQIASEVFPELKTLFEGK
ncbi:MAG: DUF4339 domain-containing protein [Planctomycetaceae bacterium]|jgi:hypothetical protein|nr:DUF4339 domain-containing protein [Planctomycetaceae bacterium]